MRLMEREVEHRIIRSSHEHLSDSFGKNLLQNRGGERHTCRMWQARAAEDGTNAVVASFRGAATNMSFAHTHPARAGALPVSAARENKAGGTRQDVSLLVQLAAFLLSQSTCPLAPERAAVLKAAAAGDISRAMDAMLLWAISERRRGHGRQPSSGLDEV